MIAALPYLLQYGVPLVTLGVGHLIGWIRARRSVKKEVAAAHNAGFASGVKATETQKPEVKQ